MAFDENGASGGSLSPAWSVDGGGHGDRPDDVGPGGGLRAEISKRIVRLHKETYGKGPTRARTYVDRDLIVCVLGGALTRAEQTLAEHGRTQLVMDQRAAWQEAMRERFVGLVEDATDRRVLAFMSTNHVDPDIVAEIFLLEPAAGADESESVAAPRHDSS